VVVSTFEALFLAILLFGVAVPAWSFLTLFYLGRRWDERRSESHVASDHHGQRYFAYARIIREIWAEMHSNPNIAAIAIAGLRELREFAEFGDLTVLLIDEISVHGDSHFDHLMKQEISRLQTSLLERTNE
jgi:hypothetical protein